MSPYNCDMLYGCLFIFYVNADTPICVCVCVYLSIYVHISIYSLWPTGRSRPQRDGMSVWEEYTAENRLEQK